MRQSPFGELYGWRCRTYPQLRCFAACSGFHYYRSRSAEPAAPTICIIFLSKKTCLYVFLSKKHVFTSSCLKKHVFMSSCPKNHVFMSSCLKKHVFMSSCPKTLSSRLNTKKGFAILNRETLSYYVNAMRRCRLHSFVLLLNDNLASCTVRELEDVDALNRSRNL